MTTIEKIQKTCRDIQKKSEELKELLKSKDVVCWQNDTGDTFGQIIDSEVAHSLVLRNILGFEEYYSCVFRTPIESLKYEIEVAKIEKKSTEGSIKNYQERIEELEKNLKEMNKQVTDSITKDSDIYNPSSM